MDFPLIRSLRRDMFSEFEGYPTWLMRQAGRSMGAYRKLREKHSFLEMTTNPRLAAEITLQPVQGHGVDGAILFSDILFPLKGMGLEIDFNPGPIIKNPVRGKSDIKGLREFDAEESCGFIMEAVRLSKERLQDRVPLIGFTGAPFTLAAYATQGGHVGEFLHTDKLIANEPDAFREFMVKLTDATTQLLQAQAEAGADALMLFDTWAAHEPRGWGKESKFFPSVILPHLINIFSNLRKTFKPLIYMARNTGSLLENLKNVGADAYVIDWTASPQSARKALGEGVALMGNLNPEILLSDAQSARKNGFELASNGVFDIPSLGHGVPQNAPEENVTAFVEGIHAAKRKNPAGKGCAKT